MDSDVDDDDEGWSGCMNEFGSDFGDCDQTFRGFGPNVQYSTYLSANGPHCCCCAIKSV